MSKYRPFSQVTQFLYILMQYNAWWSPAVKLNCYFARTTTDAPSEKQVHDQAVNYNSHLMNGGGGKRWHICPSPTRIIVCDNVSYVLWEITQSNGHTNIYSIFAMIFQGTRAPSTTKQLQISCKTRCVLEMQLELGVILWVSFAGQ